MNKRFALAFFAALAVFFVFMLSRNGHQNEAQASSVQEEKLQQDIVSFLSDQLKKQNVPLASIEILQESPLKVEISIQSTSLTDKPLPEDVINRHWAYRETIFARQSGFNIDEVVLKVVNQNHAQIYWASHSLNDEFYPLDFLFSPITDAPTLDESEIEKVVQETMSPGGMTIREVEINSSHDFRVLTIRFLSPSVQTANETIPQLILSSLPELMREVNQRGANVAIIILEVKDEQGIPLFTYLIDSQIGTEIAWQGDDVTDDWMMSVPPPAPE